MIDMAHPAHHHARSPIVAVAPRQHLCAAHILYQLLSAKNAAPQSMVAVRCGLRQLKNQIIWRIFSGSNFLQYHFALAFQLFVFKRGGCKYIGQNIHGQRPIIFQGARIISRGLHASCGIDFAACTFNFFGNALGGAPFGAFKSHVFQKMRHAIFIGHFITRTSFDPNAQSHRFKMRHHLRDDGQAVGQFGDFNSQNRFPQRC